MSKRLVLIALAVLIAIGAFAATKVEIWSWRTQDAQVWDEVQKRLDEMGKDITIDFRAFLPTEYDSKVLLALQGGQGPDIMYTRRLPGGRTKALVDSGLLIPLSDKVDFSNFSEGVLTNITQEGLQYGVPFAVQVVGIFYNKDMFDKFGLSEPRSWAELIDICEVIKANSIDPFFVSGKEAWSLVMQHAMTGVSILGPGWIKRLAEGKVDFLDQDWIYHQHLLNDLKVYYQDGFLANDTNDLNSAIAFEQAAMVFYGVWGYQMWKELNPDLNIGYFMVPSDYAGYDPYAYVYMDGAFGLTANAKHPQEALEILKFTATPEFGTIFSNITMNIPAVTGAQMPDVPLLAEVNEVAATSASPWVYWVGSEFVTGAPSLYTDVLSPGMQAMYADKITPEELAQQAQDALSQWFPPLMERLGK
ncbi:MAG TPA: extracellular solute-binding protein [Thermotogota bacterium]|nr:extracellular solute-binding protein [Thermotogota bacterium]HRW92229.1 extracellular solute-binding protein [Thermotogota bacterium]